MWEIEKRSGREESESECWYGMLKNPPCGVCGERASCNCIQCTKCQRWFL